MITLFMFEEIPERCFFFETEGDYRHFHDVYINGDGGTQEQQTALNDLVYDSDGKVKHEMMQAPTKHWTFFVRCGFIL